MKRLLQMTMIVGILFLLVGCNWFGNNNKPNTPNNNNGNMNEMPNNPQPNGNNQNGNQTTSYSSIREYMSALQSGGMTVSNEMDITEFNFPALEGKQFRMDEKDFYLYRVDSTKQDVKQFLQDIDMNQKISVTQNGMERKMPAYRMGDFVLVYPEGYDISQIQKVFSNQ
ncbi:MAG: hypothetical protein PUF50_06270 [Erysipelotrichaceae bacterium]|nr:hypothetical protein [Erysipelotrichaceae bacterium]